MSVKIFAHVAQLHNDDPKQPVTYMHAVGEAVQDGTTGQYELATLYTDEFYSVQEWVTFLSWQRAFVTVTTDDGDTIDVDDLIANVLPSVNKAGA